MRPCKELPLPTPDLINCQNVHVLHDLPPNINQIPCHHLDLAYQFICPPDVALILTSDDSLSLLPPSLPFFLFLSLVALTQNCHMCSHLYCVFTYIYSLLIEKDLHECRNISVKFPCALLVYLCLLSGDFLIFFSKSIPFLLLFLRLKLAWIESLAT